jgi:hypothetical protein
MIDCVREEITRSRFGSILSRIPFVLLLTAPLVGQTLTITPPRPDSKTATIVKLEGIWGDSCTPDNPVVSLLDANINIDLTTRSGLCAEVLTAWSQKVSVGPLDPGLYTVRALINHQLVRQSTLYVTDADAPFTVSVSGAPERGNLDVDLISRSDKPINVCGSQQCAPASVTFGGVPALAFEFRPPLIIHATVPAHAAGAVDVKVTNASATYTTRSGLIYFSESAPADPALFAPILLPLIFEADGAGGTHWKTDALLVNRSEGALVSHRSLDGTGAQYGRNHILQGALQYPRGVLWMPLRDVEQDAFAEVTVRETTHGSAFELPLVRERDFSDNVYLAGVPRDPRYRVTLRIYSLEPQSSPMNVSLHRLDSDSTIAHATVKLSRQGDDEPYFAVIPDVFAIDSQLSSRFDPMMNITIDGGSQSLWAFVSIVDNETQQARIITPLR